MIRGMHFDVGNSVRRSDSLLLRPAFIMHAYLLAQVLERFSPPGCLIASDDPNTSMPRVSTFREQGAGEADRATHRQEWVCQRP